MVVDTAEVGTAEVDTGDSYVALKACASMQLEGAREGY